MAEDERTAVFYRQKAGVLVEQYETVAPRLAARLAALLRPGGRALDVGAGSGRDLACLLSNGLDAHGIEPCPELRELAARLHPEVAGRLADASLPELGRPFGGGFDGLLLSAVLMHVPAEALPRAARSLAGLLLPGGYLLSSVSARRPGLDAEHRDAGGRLFVPISADELQALFVAAGLTPLDITTTGDALGRPGHEWTEALFAKR